MIPLDRLAPNLDYQPRALGLSAAHVRLLMESGADTFPPLLVTPNDAGGFDILDGFHRLEAARRLDMPALPCVVSGDGGYGEAVLANLRHGLPLAMDDRKDAARWWADRDPDLSFREIGRRCGLSDKTVKRAIESGDDGHRTGGTSDARPYPATGDARLRRLPRRPRPNPVRSRRRRQPASVPPPNRNLRRRRAARCRSRLGRVRSGVHRRGPTV